jgi:RNA polymerase primary sigma factor
MSGIAARRRRGANHDDSLTTYLDEISAYPLLSREDEIALARRIRAGDSAAVGQLVCSNLRFVVAVAKKYQNQGVALSDLINEGNLGLIRAAEKFDETKGVKFISYAVWWIRQAVVQAVAEFGHTVRVPVGRAGVLYRIGRRTNALRHELGREPTQAEIAEGVDASAKDLALAMPIARGCLSLDAPIGDGARLLDVLADSRAAAPDEEVLDDGLEGLVQAALELLRPREALVLKMYFGFGGTEAMTLEHIGEILGVTRERVRQIREKGLARIRKSDRSQTLAAFAGV